MDGFSMTALVKELNHKLTGGRIDKIFQTSDYELLIWIRLPGENLRLSLSANPEHARVHIASESPLNPQSPPAFCMLLRKQLEDGRIASVRQHGRDRVIILDIDTRGENGVIVTKQLVAEIMGKYSNIILLEDNTIIEAIKRVGPSQSRYRHVLPGRQYICPPDQNRLDPFCTSPEDLISCWQGKSGSFVKAVIAAVDGIGPTSAKEFVFRAGLASDALLENTSSAEQLAVAQEMKRISEQLCTGAHQPTAVYDEHKRLLGVAAFPLKHLAGYESRTFPTVSEAIEFADKLKGIRQPQEKTELTKLIASEISKNNRKIALLASELEEAMHADELRQTADILMANAYHIPAGSSEVCLPDLYQDHTPLVKISLETTLTAIENANSYYNKYNKLKRARELLAKQLQQTEQEVMYLESLSVSLEHAHSHEDISEIRQELAIEGYLRISGKKRKLQAASQPLCYKLSNGFIAYVGKNNRQNDLLTMKQAKADDLWLHTKDIPGSHVIVRLDGREPDAKVILQAAQLAAYYSKARNSSNVPVDYTRRRFVRKPSGAKPGFVIYDHQSTVYVTPDENLIQSWK